MNYNLDLSGSLNPVDKFSVQAKFDLGDSGPSGPGPGGGGHCTCRASRSSQTATTTKALALWEEVLKLDPKYQPAADDIRTVQHTMALQEQTADGDAEVARS